MAVAKRQGKEKPVKIEQRKVLGPECGPQVKQTAVLASPIYIGQTQGEEKEKKESVLGSLRDWECVFGKEGMRNGIAFCEGKRK